MESKAKSEFEVRNFGDDGVSLTWQDLCVSAHNIATGKTKRILEDVTGYACPGQVLAILGPTGCGKTTLLNALAGRLDLSIQQSGKILINGCKQALPHGTLGYVTQDNILLATLTVRETLYYTSELLLPPSISKLEKQQRAEECIKEMGLQDAIDTRVGGWGVEGLSGGEKKRLSLCIELLSPSKVLFLDEPTSGLDSAASFYVMSSILCKETTIGRTIIATIHQPSSQIFELFENLCLLSAGRTVYFGPAKEANQFFILNDLPCPSQRNPSEHFLQMINKDFDECGFYKNIEQEQSTSKKTVQEIINCLVNSYNSSESYQQVQGVINSICKQKEKNLEIKRRRASFFLQCQVLTRRSLVNMSRDYGYYWLRLFVQVILGLGMGHMFYDLEPGFNTFHARTCLIMFAVGYWSMFVMAGILSFIEEIKVFKREWRNGHYGITSYVMGHILSSMPFLLLISFLTGGIVYYLPGLQKEHQKFVYFIFVLLVCSLLVESLVMTVVFLVPNFLLGGAIGGLIQGLMALSSGFIRLPNDLPRLFWRYPIFYISFHRYAYQGLLKNEFGGTEYPIVIGTSSNMISGDSILKSLLQLDTRYSKWRDLAILLGMVIIYHLFFILVISTLDKVKPLLRARLERKATKKST